MTSPPESVQIVDLAPFINGSNKAGVAEQMLDSFKSIGFVYLVNHGLRQDKIKEMFTWSNTLFDQPDEVKQLAPHPESGAHHRGYSSPGREKVIRFDSVSESNPPGQLVRDIKESFEVGREDMPGMPNIWFPEGVLPGFKEACLDFYWRCFEIEKLILRVLAVGFGLPEDYFFQYHSKADNQLRLLHYPSIPSSMLADERASRIPSHTDFCSITLLLQDDIGGLEVEHPKKPGIFVPVPPIPESIVVNAGDFLMRWSNDMIKSTVHQVRLPQAFKDSGVDGKFCAADLDTIVDSIPGTWSSTRPKLYSPISAKEYISERLAANY
ncbi:hypothetical protein D9613_002416 [Agrocybe pediades]|uniref:Fe2OG dioxygenase domain-containing protein n=1 Tax=Agrocybe pediades TaxID=84607 RepID=A0A8H4VX03_9AGAR|nr:hypothetical protein D9613_002416 [Agrocybe pediades]